MKNPLKNKDAKDSPAESRAKESVKRQMAAETPGSTVPEAFTPASQSFALASGDVIGAPSDYDRELIKEQREKVAKAIHEQGARQTEEEAEQTKAVLEETDELEKSLKKDEDEPKTIKASSPLDEVRRISVNGHDYFVGGGDTTVGPLHPGDTPEMVADMISRVLGPLGVTVKIDGGKSKRRSATATDKGESFTLDDLEEDTTKTFLPESAMKQPFRIPNDDQHYSPEQLKRMRRNWAAQERAQAMNLNPERAKEYDPKALATGEVEKVKRTGAKRRLAEEKK
jgi:hypothetical protein